ncbi:unnamed protein product [Rotaria sp. Silwood1]|nr:unnamed protein product [Rotaria sp. Silwood1]CAF4084854.1 unnamed protein product [Rotaria sp. Silwood1]
MKEIIKTDQLISSTAADNQQSFVSSDAAPHQGSSSLNLVSSTPVSVAMTSDSTLFKSSSTSILTDD